MDSFEYCVNMNNWWSSILFVLLVLIGDEGVDVDREVWGLDDGNVVQFIGDFSQSNNPQRKVHLYQ